MRFIIVTGMSGAGKSTALNCLEDMGYYCMDNLPPLLLRTMYGLLADVKEINRAAIGVDVRGGGFFDDVYDELARLDQGHMEYEILFLDCQSDVLIRRYKENRRTHPVDAESLPKSIEKERELLRRLRAEAHTVIDTTKINIHELKARVMELYGDTRKDGRFPVHVISFGFKNGIPKEADIVLDVRFLDNTFYNNELKALTGLDASVAQFVLNNEDTKEFLVKETDLLEFLLPRYIREGKNTLVIAIGCTGGRHRSVALAEALSRWLQEKGFVVQTEHRDILTEGSAR